MKNIRFFFSENFPFLVVKFSIYLNRHVFVMVIFETTKKKSQLTISARQTKTNTCANSVDPDETV